MRVYMMVDETEDAVAITDTVTGEVYAVHPFCHGKGMLIGRCDRAERYKSDTIIEQEILVRELFDNNELIEPFLEQVHQTKRRYYRDQLGAIRNLFKECDKEDIINGLIYCSERGLYSAGDLKSSTIYLAQSRPDRHKPDRYDGPFLPAKYREDKTELRSPSVYENAMN